MSCVLLGAALLVASEFAAAAPNAFLGYAPSAAYGLDRGMNYGQPLNQPSYGPGYGARYFGPSGQSFNANTPMGTNYFGQPYADASKQLPPLGLAEAQQGNIQQQPAPLQPELQSYDPSSALQLQPSMPVNTHFQQSFPTEANSALPPFQQFTQQMPQSTEASSALQFQQQVQQSMQEQQIQNRVSQLQEQQKQQQKQQESLIKMIQEQQTTWKKANSEVEEEKQQMHSVMAAVLNATEMLSKAVKRSVSRELQMQAPVQALQARTTQLEATMAQSLGKIEADVEDTKALAATAQASAEQASVAARVQKLASDAVQPAAASSAAVSTMTANSPVVSNMAASSQSAAIPSFASWFRPAGTPESAVAVTPAPQTPSLAWFSSAKTPEATAAGTPAVATTLSQSFLRPAGGLEFKDYEDAVPTAK